MPEANPKGEVSLEIDGFDEPFTLTFSFDDMADADELLGRSLIGELRDIENNGDIRMDTIRSLLYITARPDSRIPSPKQTRGIITFDTMEQVTAAVLNTIYENLPQPETEKIKSNGQPDPTEAAGAPTTTGS